MFVIALYNKTDFIQKLRKCLCKQFNALIHTFYLNKTLLIAFSYVTHPYSSNFKFLQIKAPTKNSISSIKNNRFLT